MIKFEIEKKKDLLYCFTFSSAFNILSFIPWKHRNRIAMVFGIEGPGKGRNHVESKLATKGEKSIKKIHLYKLLIID